ncbi:MAG: hypothetical protein WB689_26370 [Xanthobacteraceae bacterium]
MTSSKIIADLKDMLRAFQGKRLVGAVGHAATRSSSPIPAK